MKAIGHIREPLSFWLGDPQQLMANRSKILFVGQQESLAEDVARLSQILGLVTPLALPTDPVQAHRNPTNRSSSLSERGTAAIREWYADDYALIDLSLTLSGERPGGD